MKATINGELRDLPDGITVGRLLETLGTPRNSVAVALNQRVVRRAQYDSDSIGEGDCIEIIKAVAGG